MEKHEQIIRVRRRYNKSEAPRFRWTPELHEHFIQMVEQLGGKYKATPKRILEMMGVRGLQMSHVKSHLQMYRSMRPSTTKNISMFIDYNFDVQNLDHNHELFAFCSPKSRKHNKRLREEKEEEKSEIIQMKDYSYGYENQGINSEKTKKIQDFVGGNESSEISTSLYESEKLGNLWPSNDNETSQDNAGEKYFVCSQIPERSNINLDLKISTPFSY